MVLFFTAANIIQNTYLSKQNYHGNVIKKP